MKVSKRDDFITGCRGPKNPEGEPSAGGRRDGPERFLVALRRVDAEKSDAAQRLTVDGITVTPNRTQGLVGRTGAVLPNGVLR